MYFTDNGFVISAREITTIIVVIIIFYFGIRILYWKISSTIAGVCSKSEDYPGFGETNVNNRSNIVFSDVADIYVKNDSDGNNSYDSDLNVERREKVIFEENISGVPFRYDEKTRVLKIGGRDDIKNTLPIEVKLNSFDELRDFVDRLEDYVNE